MKKSEFLNCLRASLGGLPREDVERSEEYYSEMIDDRMEEGLSEEDAVREIGSIEEIVAQTLSEIPLSKLVREKIRPKKRLNAWVIVLLALGSPIWLSLIVSAFAVLISLYATIWSVAVSLWSVFVSFVASGFAGVVAGIAVGVFQNPLAGIALFGLGLVCAGLSAFFFFGCKATTKGTVLLTKGMALAIKKLLIGKENRT